jgi:hypothetical protein
MQRRISYLMSVLPGLLVTAACTDDFSGVDTFASITWTPSDNPDGTTETGEPSVGDGDGDPGDGDGDTGDGDGDTGDGDGESPCAQGAIVCIDGAAMTCDGMGGAEDTTQCAVECVDGLGCVLCSPGAQMCMGDKSFTCTPEGDAWEESQVCDNLQGVVCNPDSGACEGACAPDQLGLSYIGCDYYPTVTAGLRELNPWPFHYAAVVANTSDQLANITVTRGDMVVAQQEVGPNTAQVIQLPYIEELANSALNQPGPSLMVPDGAYRLRSTQPVTVYQFNPIEYELDNDYSYINDAGLLFPVNTWGESVRVVSRNHWLANNQFHLPGFYAVTSKQDGTVVTIEPSESGGWVYAGGGVASDGTGQVVLDEGDVLEVFTSAGQPSPFNSDLTGTLITATNPIQVIGGHKCTNVPQNIQFCDRLEESIPPLATVGKSYIVTAPLIPTGGSEPKAEIVRITATEDDTDLSYDPPQIGAPANIATAGQWVDLPQNANSFEVSSSKKILVSQYMLGQNAGGNSGDPAMTMTVATQQFRTHYLVHAPANYTYSYANIVAPNGASIIVDDQLVNWFQEIGDTGYSIARVTLSNFGDGNHTATGNHPFGITVYGYGQYTSYWYPGGLNLELIPQ